MSQPRVLVVGSGYVGSVVARLLLEAGQMPLALRRRPQPSAFPSIAADLSSGEGLAAIPSGIEQIVFTAAPDERSVAAYRSVYVEGASRLLARLPRARFVFVSSTTVYGGASGQIDEETRCEPEADSALVLLEAEQLVARAAGGALIVRASGIYGPGRTSLLARLAQTRLEEDERAHVTNRIHRDDLARFLAFCLAHRKLSGIYNASDSAPSTLGEMQDWLKGRGEPDWLLEARSAPRRGGTSIRAILNDKLLASGFELSYPSFREGYAAVLDEGANPTQ